MHELELRPPEGVDVGDALRDLVLRVDALRWEGDGAFFLADSASSWNCTLLARDQRLLLQVPTRRELRAETTRAVLAQLSSMGFTPYEEGDDLPLGRDELLGS
jgi:hypothetical protein